MANTPERNTMKPSPAGLRITQATTCTVIDLAADEPYDGAGLRLAEFLGGDLIRIKNPVDVPVDDDLNAMANAALQDALAWLRTCTGETWLGVMSGRQFCQPTPIEPTNANDIAHLARRIGDEIARREIGE